MNDKLQRSMAFLFVALLSACTSPSGLVDGGRATDLSWASPPSQRASAFDNRVADGLRLMDISEDGRHIVLEIESSPCYPTEVEGLVEREDAVEVRLHVGNVMPQDENVMCPPVLQFLRQEFTLASPLGGRTIERSASQADSTDT